ncbi:MAG: hypothetical protein RBU37_27250, partial [Myxococcota bacterium]|nr:hypothetical protein [Myxococcota bacterium]
MSNEESTILHEEALELLQRADELSFTPGKAALRTLVAHLAAATEDDVSRTAILMLRSPEEAAKQLWALVRAQATQLSPDQVETRCRALQLLGRLAHEGAQHWLWLPISESLRSPHDRVRRYAARALARCRAERSELETLEAALLAAWESESQGPELKAMAQALARIGGERSLARLSAMPTQSKVSEGHASSRHSTGIAAVERSVPESERMPSDPHLAQVIEDALHALRARSSRSPKQAWVFDLAPRAGLPPVPLILSCRLGLGSLLAEELRASSPRLLSPDRVLLPRGLAAL